MTKDELVYLPPTASLENACYIPPQRTWVDLTDEELEILFFESKDAVELCEAIQAKHKEKNT